MKAPLRTKSIGTKVSEEEFAALEECARQANMTLSEWVRAVLLAAPGVELPDDEAALAGRVAGGPLKRFLLEWGTGMPVSAMSMGAPGPDSGTWENWLPILHLGVVCRVPQVSILRPGKAPRRGPTQPYAVFNHHARKPLSTDRRPWGILVIVHSVSRVTDCSTQPASPVPIEWTTS